MREISEIVTDSCFKIEKLSAVLGKKGTYFETAVFIYSLNVTYG